MLIRLLKNLILLHYYCYYVNMYLNSLQICTMNKMIIVISTDEELCIEIFAMINSSAVSTELLTM